MGLTQNKEVTLDSFIFKRTPTGSSLRTLLLLIYLFFTLSLPIKLKNELNSLNYQGSMKKVKLKANKAQSEWFEIT